MLHNPRSVILLMTESSNHVRKAFTITEDVDELIDDLAAESHGANRSECVRAAIYEKAKNRTERELQNSIKKSRDDIEEISRDIKEIKSSIKERQKLAQAGEISNSGSAVSLELDSPTDQESSSEAAIAREILSEIKTSNGVRFENLVVRSGYKEEKIGKALQKLCNRGVVKRNKSKNGIRYISE